MRRTRPQKPRQSALPWPGSDEICPRCHGAREVYHRTTLPGVEILGGKRMPCPTCQAVGTVRAPRASLVTDPLAAKPGAAGA
jgi:hypothetical protein